MKTRTVLLAGVAALFCLQAEAQVVVTDPGNLAQWFQGLAADAKAYALQVQQELTETQELIGSQLSWAKQALQYSTQLQQYAQEIELYENFFHYPSLGAAMGLLQAAGLGSELPSSGYSVLGLVNGVRYGTGGLPEIAGLSGMLSGLVGTSYTQNHVYTPTDGSWASGTVTANANTIAAAQGSGATAYNDLQNHTGVLAGLRSQLLTTSDSKGVADLTAQVQLETAYNMNENAKLAALNIAAQAQGDSRAQQDNEHIDKDLETDLASSAP